MTLLKKTKALRDKIATAEANGETDFEYKFLTPDLLYPSDEHWVISHALSNLEFSERRSLIDDDYKDPAYRVDQIFQQPLEQLLFDIYHSSTTPLTWHYWHNRDNNRQVLRRMTQHELNLIVAGLELLFESKNPEGSKSTLRDLKSHFSRSDEAVARVEERFKIKEPEQKKS